MLLYISVILSISACECEGTFITYSKLENRSTVDISIKTYRNGVIYSKIILVGRNEVAMLDQNSGRTKAIVHSSYLGVLDSLIIEFNNTKKATHYGYSKTGNNSQAILSTNNRSLFNSVGYVQKTVKDTKCYLETDFVYTFTEQDYLNAK